MRFDKRTLTTLLAVACATCAATPAADAAHASGGAAAPSGASPGSLGGGVRSSAIATWFGPGFYGNTTACGQTLTPAVIGVANRTLPCGTLVSVTYRGRTLTVPVLDRGPYSHIGADWDLTAGAAEALGITGTARIHTRIVGSTPNTPSLGLPPASKSAAVAGGALAG